MAEIVDSLFGPSPWQVQQARAAEQQKYAAQLSNMDNLQQAKFGIAQGAGQLAQAGAGMMGMVDPAVAQSQRREAVMASGGDLSTSAGLKAKAAQFAAAGDQQTAMKLVIAARAQEAKEQQMAVELRKQALGERKQDFQETEAFDLKKMQIEAVIRQADEKIADKRTSDAEKVAAQREKIQAYLILGQMANAMKQSGGGKAPMGYRYTPEGDLEPIPGGPADAKARAQAEAKATGSTDVDVAVSGLRDAYNRLEKGGGITTVKNAGVGNIPAAISSSGIGQMAGKVLGTANQSARNEIAMTRPALLAALMKATGMSAKQMDSNAELKLWIATATDPQLDVEANRKALDNIERKYLGSSGVSKPQGEWSIKKK